MTASTAPYFRNRHRCALQSPPECWRFLQSTTVHGGMDAYRFLLASFPQSRHHEPLPVELLLSGLNLSKLSFLLQFPQILTSGLAIGVSP
jgi:hypothetical protein